MAAETTSFYSGYDGLLDRTGFMAAFRWVATDKAGRYRWWALHLPNALCWLRLVLGPPLIVVLGWAQLTGRMALAGWLVVALGLLILTDLFDGPLARAMGIAGQKIGWWDGGALDATADKALMLSFFIETAIVVPIIFGTRVANLYALTALTALALDLVLLVVTFREQHLATRLNRRDRLPKAGRAGKWKLHLQAVGAMLASAAVVWPDVFGELSLALTPAILTAACLLAVKSLRGHLANLHQLQRARRTS